LATAALVAAYGARAARLKHRVRAGGHHVPYDKIRKRQRRLWTLVAEAITACDIATVYDNSRLGPRIVAQCCARACGA
jgi:predicted ABC-type ATPase